MLERSAMNLIGIHGQSVVMKQEYFPVAGCSAPEASSRLQEELWDQISFCDFHLWINVSLDCRPLRHHITTICFCLKTSRKISSILTYFGLGKSLVKGWHGKHYKPRHRCSRPGWHPNCHRSQKLLKLKMWQRLEKFKFNCKDVSVPCPKTAYN